MRLSVLAVLASLCGSALADELPHWTELAMQDHSFRALPFTLDGSPLAATSREDLATRAFAPTVRFLFGRELYAGVELATGWIARTPQAIGITQPDGSTYFGAGVVGGARVPIWHFAIGAELAAGGRAIDLEACEPVPGIRGCTGPNAWETRRQLEARLKLDLFTSPQISIGVMIGKSLVDAGDTTIMFGFGGHTRALDGITKP